MPKRKASTAAEKYSQLLSNTSTPPTTKPKHNLINTTNALPPSEFEDRYLKDESLSTPEFHITFKSSSQLDENELTTCLELIESTSRHDYENSSIGWHPKRKKREMREPEMRYLLIRQAPSSNPAEGVTDDSLEPIQGFLSFMLTHDSIPAVPVIYLYEIHLAQRLRKRGLGAHLMDIIESVAEKIGVEKVMLTCFLSNERAYGFYQRRGYGVDVSSPEDRTTRGKTSKVDYVIMSKDVSSAGLNGVER